MPPEPFRGRLASPGECDEEGSLCGVSTCVLGAGCGELVAAGATAVGVDVGDVVPPPIGVGGMFCVGGCCPGGVTVTEGAPHMLLPPAPAPPPNPSPPDFPFGDGPPGGGGSGGGVGGVVGGGVAGWSWTWVPVVGCAAGGVAGGGGGGGGGGGPSCCYCSCSCC